MTTKRKAYTPVFQNRNILKRQKIRNAIGVTISLTRKETENERTVKREELKGESEEREKSEKGRVCFPSLPD